MEDERFMLKKLWDLATVRKFEWGLCEVTIVLVFTRTLIKGLELNEAVYLDSNVSSTVMIY